MVKNGVQPTAITLGCMIQALVANKRTTPAWELVQEMRKDEATRPLVNTVIYSTILKGFANAKETDKVMSLYEEMKANDIHPNNITYNTILNAFAQGGAMDRVPALLEDMKKAVPPAEPDLVSFSTIIKGYCNAGSLDRALQVVEDMRSQGKLTPDEVMYNSLLDGCAKEQRPNEAMKLLDDMRKTGVRPSNFTLSMLVKLMGRCRRLNQAFSIIEDLSKEYGLKVNIQVYTCLIQACFNSRQAARAVALHDQIVAEGVIPDEMTYSVLVKGALQGGLIDKAVYLTKCAYGLGGPNFHGSPPGIKSNNLDDLVAALGGPKGKEALRLLDDIAQAQVARAPVKGKGKGGAKGRSSTPPWRKN
jgi:pentatricopeptide repeat protein